MTNATAILIEKIDVEDRIREVDQAVVPVIISSFREIGQKTPIEVKAKPDGRWRLVAGLHRLEAARALGWTEIHAIAFEGDDNEARLWEIDENLARVELSAFDEANFLAERRELWERIHGEVKRGGDKRSKGQICPLAEAVRQKGFFAETAERFGLHPKSIKRALTRKAQISGPLWAALKTTEAAKNAAMLDKVRKLNTEEQSLVLQMLRERGCTVGEAVRQVTKLPPRDPDQVQFEALIAAWVKASPAVRKRFVATTVNAKGFKAEAVRKSNSQSSFDK